MARQVKARLESAARLECHGELMEARLARARATQAEDEAKRAEAVTKLEAAMFVRATAQAKRARALAQAQTHAKMAQAVPPFSSRSGPRGGVAAEAEVRGPDT